MFGSAFFEDLQIKNISVLSGVRSRGRTVDFSIAGRRTHGMLYLSRGECTFFLNTGEVVSLREGELAYLPKYKKYRMQYTGDETAFILVDCELYDKEGEELFLFDTIVPIAKDDATHNVSKTMSDFASCGASKTTRVTLRKKELFYRMLAFMDTVFSPANLGERCRTIENGVRLLEQTYLEDLRIEEYAKACFVSVNTFRALFLKHFGTSPLKYRNRLRIERARELLLDGTFTVAEVAYASGFKNIGYFCRYYRALTGETPAETRIQNK